MIYHTHERLRTQVMDTTYHLDDLQQTVEDAMSDLGPKRASFDSIVVTGMSGVVVGVPVALALNVPLAILRKDKEDSHASRSWVGEAKIGTKALWLDDFVSCGDTRDRVRDRVARLGTGAQVCFQYLYHGRVFRSLDPWVPRPSPWKQTPPVTSEKTVEGEWMPF